MILREQRHILLQGRRLAYILRRSARRRSLALEVGAQGLTVAVPQRCTEGDIRAFITQHADWLLARMEQVACRPPAPRLSVEDGAHFPLFGRPCRLRMQAGLRSPRWRPDADGQEALVLPAAGRPVVALERALRQRALDWFRGRVDEYCHRLDLPVPPVGLSAARTRWGSCSLRSGIRLHWRLVHLPPALAEYVVAHEVAHLREMNHSPRFWSVVESVYPDWRAARAALREAAAQLPVFLAPGEGDDREAATDFNPQQED